MRSCVGSNKEDFVLEEEIGCGGFAKVFKARSKKRGFKNEKLAIKKISKKDAKERNCTLKILSEIEIHSKLPPHPNYVKFHVSFEDADYWYLVMELCDGGSFEEYLKRKGPLSEKEAAYLMTEVIAGVRSLHENNIIHRDLSLRNLLLTGSPDKLQVKIADFGLAVKLDYPGEKKNTVLGTPKYMSPEVINHDSYDFKVDCWSIGCVLYALLYGSPPFNGKKTEDIMKNVKHSQLTFPSSASTEAKQLLKSLLNKDPKQRVHLEDVLKFDFFKKYDDSVKRNEISSSKNSKDSGMNSLSRSNSRKSQSTLISAERNKGSSRDRLQKEKKSKPVKNNPLIKSHDNSYDNARFDQQQYHVISQNQSYDFQNDTPVKKRPEFQAYPADELKELAEINISTHISQSELPNFKNHSKTHTNNSKYNSTSRQKSHTDSYADVSVKDPSCSYDQYRSPKNNCSQLNYQQMKNGSNPSLANLKKANSNIEDIRSSVVEKCKDPLNTTRISYRRKEIEKKDVVVSILNDGQVSLEYYRIKKGEKYIKFVYFISGDGDKITIYKPEKSIILNADQPPALPDNGHEVQNFTFETLPYTSWKKYKFAKMFVDKVRSITPKIIIHGKQGSCKMMENIPNPIFEMKFYDGFQIIETMENNKQKLLSGYEDDSVTIETDELESRRNEFFFMKEQCRKLEKYIDEFHESNFPVVVGKRKPDINKSKVVQSSGKENLPPTCLPSPSANNLNSGVPFCHITIAPENITQNTFHRSMSTAFSSTNSSNSSKNITSIPSQLKSVQEENGYIIAEYTDGIEMYYYLQDNKLLFKNSKTQSFLSERENPHLKQRFQRDNQAILRCALLNKNRKT